MSERRSLISDRNESWMDFISFRRIEIDLVRCSFMFSSAIESFAVVRELRGEDCVSVEMVLVGEDVFVVVEFVGLLVELTE